MANFWALILLIWLVSVAAGVKPDVCTTSGCLAMRPAASALAPVRQMRGMLALQGSGQKCFIGLIADGSVSTQEWCRNAVPGLSLVKKWRWQAPDLLLLDASGQLVFDLHRDSNANIFRQTQPNGTIVLFYPFEAEAMPH